MKKIDLHIHTIATFSDSPFEFSLSKLQEYIVQMEIDCIAVTNHNTFDIDQFNQISKSLGIYVLPGIEIDLEGGHLLLICDKDLVSDFAIKCETIKGLIRSKDEFITVEKFKEVFPNLSNYLLIPHYDKKPIIKPETIAKLKEQIHTGEVASVRKFKSCIKEVEKLVPVLFSDSRLYDELEPFSTRQTFIDLDEISFRGIKACLSDKSKVSLSREDGNNVFQATDDGLKLSTGLNVILGERSSGKTYTLDKICDSFENVKYIKQFSLLQNDEDKFKDFLTVRQSSVSELFLKEFKEVVEDVIKVDLHQNELGLEKYITTLLKFASEFEKEDSFSKASLFSETLYPDVSLEGLKKLIDSTLLLIENTEYREIIEKHLTIQNLKSLAVELINKYKEIYELNAKKKWINELVSNIQSVLRSKTACTYPEDVDFYKIILENEKINKFSKIVQSLKIEKEIDSKEIKGFKIVACTKQFNNATHLKDKSKRKMRFIDAFNSYNNSYDFLNELKKIELLEETEYYKYFVDIDYKTLNKHGYQVSGGERSEFNLLHEIDDALKHDLLLIDEPESSFDNIFLRGEVNELIKDIAREIPVIVVTHNSTVGASIQPDYILYTQKAIVDEEIQYKVFAGYPSSKQLKGPNGELIDNYEIMLNCLEAGDDAYQKRRTKSYEILKN